MGVKNWEIKEANVERAVKWVRSKGKIKRAQNYAISDEQREQRIEKAVAEALKLGILEILLVLSYLIIYRKFVEIH